MSQITGPIAPFNNVPINAQYFQPSRFAISAISLGVTTTITTTVNHNYVIGQQVRILIPIGFGARGLNQQTGFVIAIPAANQFTLNIFSIGIDAFVTNTFITQPQVVAIGDYNTGIISSTGRVLTSTNIPGAFINISPL